MEDFHRQKRGKNVLFLLGSLPMGGWKWAMRQMSSLVLSRKIIALEKAESVTGISVKSKSDDFSLVQVTPFGDCCLFFNSSELSIIPVRKKCKYGCHSQD